MGTKSSKTKHWYEEYIGNEYRIELVLENGQKIDDIFRCSSADRNAISFWSNLYENIRCQIMLIISNWVYVPTTSYRSERATFLRDIRVSFCKDNLDLISSEVIKYREKYKQVFDYDLSYESLKINDLNSKVIFEFVSKDIIERNKFLNLFPNEQNQPINDLSSKCAHKETGDNQESGLSEVS